MVEALRDTEKSKEFGMSEEQKDTHTQRDGETLFMLGIFLTVLGLPVIVGAFWAETPAQTWVCVISGVILTAIGIAFFVHGKNVLKRLD